MNKFKKIFKQWNIVETQNFASLLIVMFLLLFFINNAEAMIMGKSFNSTYLDLKKEYQEYKPMDYYLQQNEIKSITAIEETDSTFIKETLLTFDKMKQSKNLLNNFESSFMFYNFHSEDQKQLINKIKKTNSDTTLFKEIENEFLNNLNINLLITYAYVNNSELKSIRNKWKASLQQYPQEVYLDNILKQYNAFTRVLDTKLGMQYQKEFMAKKFPLPGLLTYKGDIVKTDIIIESLEYEKALRNLITEIKMNYYDFILLQQSIKIVKENQAFLKVITTIAESKYSTGGSNFSDIIKTHIEIAKLDYELIELNNELDIIKSKFNNLLNRNPDANFVETQDFASLLDYKISITIDDLYKLTEENQQELKSIKTQIDKMQLMLEMVKRMYLPEVTSGASYFENRSDILGGVNTDMNSDMNKTFNPAPDLMMMPDYFWFNKNDAYLEELKYEIESMKNMLSHYKNIYYYTAKSFYLKLDAAEREINLYKFTLIPRAEEALKAVIAAYQAGKVDIEEIIDSFGSYLEFQLEYCKIVKEYRNNLAELENNAGVVLKKEQVNFLIKK
ncbi:MAG: TolC family protein [Candidatus Firestonebacteria bacterium]|nr:TolC family protein [Candidatus Firestonebacteria bacterium]